MDTQEIFNTVYNHMLQQNRRSVDERGQCCYRGEHGRKCAVGALIKDEYYYPDLNNMHVGTPSVLHALGKSLGGIHWDDVFDKYGDLLTQLQLVHDGCEVIQWKKRLEQLAKAYNLSVPRDTSAQVEELKRGVAAITQCELVDA